MTYITVQAVLGVVFFLVELQPQGCPPGWRGCLGCQAGAGALMTSLRLGAQSWGWAPRLDPSTCLRGVCSAWNSVHHCWFGCRQKKKLGTAEKAVAVSVTRNEKTLCGQDMLPV